MRRSQAAKLIDRVREIAADSTPLQTLDLLRSALADAGLPPLEPCGGEAHSNVWIDNCSRCAPRWGYVGKKEPVT